MSGILGALMGADETGTQCDDVVIDPNSDNTPLTVNLSTTQTGGHIFYTKASNPFDQPDGVTPTHSGDVATGPTIRIGTNNGNVSTGSGFVTIQALCYEPGFLDSDVSEGVYVGSGGP